MKRIILFGLIAIFFSQISYAQNPRPFTEFKFGMLDPIDTGSGNILGISTGRKIDNRLYWSIEINHFKTTFRKTTTIADSIVGGITFTKEQVELEFTTRIIPIFLKLDYELEMGEQSPFYFRASGGLGWEFIWNHENNFVEDIERTRFFNGLGWQVTAGLGLKISRDGLFFFDVVYNDSEATRQNERNEAGLPTFQQIDVSGFGFKAGINILNLGF